VGIFSKDNKLKFKEIPSAPEQTQARNYLVDLMENDLQFPVQGTAELTGTEQQIQGMLPSYLGMLEEDYGAARDYYNDVLSGGYDPRTSDYYQGFRAEQDMAKRDAMLDVARMGQMAGMSRSTPVVGVQARTGAAFDAQTLQQLGLLYDNERTRMGQAAGALGQLGGQQLANLSQVEQLAMVQRQQEQMKLSAMYQAALRTLLFPYEKQAGIAEVLLGEQRYTGYQTGGGLTDWGFMMAAGSNAVAGGGWPSFGGGGTTTPAPAPSGGGSAYGGVNNYSWQNFPMY
jgi:hypothetical protein